MKIIISLLTLLLYILPVYSASINVPGSFNSIQEAIDAASGGDTIIVSPGTYYENINFRGKSIFLTSMFYMASDTGYISATVINGSNPSNPDTGSCVIFNSYEDSTSVLQGFTITGGTGTIWDDIHGAGLYREGGGVLIELSSPTIRNNIITGNIVTNLSGVISSGGGGIRVGDGNPWIVNNVIINNEARYGAGIVLNYTGCIIRNNIIASNTGGQDYYGGSAIWITSNLPATPKIIENNTIVNNTAAASNGTGGIFVSTASSVFMKNNIVYGNSPVIQIKTISSTPQVSYSNVQGGFNGTGNIDQDPLFSGAGHLLQTSSSCVDAGDTDQIYNDLENTSVPGQAQVPSLGTLRNDMGAYGGPYAFVLPQVISGISNQELFSDKPIAIYPNPSVSEIFIEAEIDLMNTIYTIYDSEGRLIKSDVIRARNNISIQTSTLVPGNYYLTIQKNNKIVTSERLVISR